MDKELRDFLLKRWPTTSLLRNVAVEIIGDYVSELPGTGVEPKVYATRLVELSESLNKSNELKNLIQSDFSINLNKEVKDGGPFFLSSRRAF